MLSPTPPPQLPPPPPSRLILATPHSLQLTELAVIEALEALADPATEAGEWMAAYDLVEAGASLTLARQPAAGVCGEECRTLALAVADALDASDTDLAERLFAATAGGAPAPDLGAWLCGADGAGACVARPPPLPSTRPPGPPFVAETADAAQARRMMAQMKAAGMGGELFDRSSIEQTLAEVDAEEEAEEAADGAGGGGGGAGGKAGGGGQGPAAPAPLTEGLGGALDDLALDVAPPPHAGKGGTKRAARARAAAKRAAAAAAAASTAGGGGAAQGAVADAVGAARGWVAAAAAKARALATGRVGGGERGEL